MAKNPFCPQPHCRSSEVIASVIASVTTVARDAPTNVRSCRCQSCGCEFLAVSAGQAND